MAIADFYAKIEDDSNSGAIFFSVCRGKVSEGLDFANKNGRAVVITGIPFPSLTDAKVCIFDDWSLYSLTQVKLKKQYLDNEQRMSKGVGMTGNDWYKQCASRAVNQAVGRVSLFLFKHDPWVAGGETQ